MHRWRDILYFVYGIDLASKPEKKGKEVKEELEKVETEKETEEKKEEAPKRSLISDDLKGKKFENLGIWVEVNMYFKNFKRIKL